MFSYDSEEEMGHTILCPVMLPKIYHQEDTTNERVNRNCSEGVSHKSLNEPEPMLLFLCCLKCETLLVTSRKTI